MNVAVVDANCLAYFQKERLNTSSAKFSAMIDCLLAWGLMAIDDEGKAQQEYFNCCRPSPVGLNLGDWISDQIVAGKIKMFAMDRSCDKKLGQLGVPPKDKKWVAIAKGSGATLIVTEDCDLFEPRANDWSAAKKNKIKSTCTGCVAVYLRKSHGIHVRTADMVSSFCS